MKKYLDNKGVTLVELAVVVAIIGIMVAIGLPNYLKMLPHLRLKGAATDVASAMQHARMAAIAKNADQTITFIASTPTVPGSFAYGNVSSRDWKDVDIYNETGALAGGVPSRLIYTYQSNGTATVSPAIIEPEGAVYLQNHSDTAKIYRVKVELMTGLIRIQEYNGSAWVD